MEQEKQWWAPVWKGLVMDPDARHYQRIKSAIWLFLYLLLNANRRTGSLLRKVRTICSDTGIKERTIRAWLSMLRDRGYIETRRTGHCLLIWIIKWKALPRWQDDANQKGRLLPVRVAEGCQSGQALEGQNPIYSGRKISACFAANDIPIKRDLLKNDIEGKNSLESDRSTHGRFRPRTREELLAWDLAEALNDRKGLALYLSYAKKYPESLLRRVLGEVQEIPDQNIKKGRGALFNHLVQKYVQEASNSSGD